MAIARLFDFLPPAALACVGVVGLVRMVALSRRGVRVVVVDPQRSTAEMVFDGVVIVVGLFWVYLAIAPAWPPNWSTPGSNAFSEISMSCRRRIWGISCWNRPAGKARSTGRPSLPARSESSARLDRWL